MKKLPKTMTKNPSVTELRLAGSILPRRLAVGWLVLTLLLGVSFSQLAQGGDVSMRQANRRSTCSLA